MTVNACLCDDDPVDMARYAAMIISLGRAHGLTVRMQTFSDGLALYDAMERGRCNPDLVFMDVLMSGQNGVQTAVMLRKLCWSSLLIFLTITPTYALPAFDAEPFAYIVKSSRTAEKLSGVLLRAARELRHRPTGSYLCVTKQGAMLIPLREIRYFAVLGHSIEIYREQESSPIRHNGRISELEKQLCQAQHAFFVRIHRSYLVNISRIQLLYPQQLQTVDGDILPVGGKYADAVKRALLSCHAAVVPFAASAKSEG